MDWVKRNYPKPQVDPVRSSARIYQANCAPDTSGNLQGWLDECYEYIVETHHLNPASQTAQIIEKIEYELLHSDLADSMVPGSGLPQDIGNDDSYTQIKGPLLVELIAMDEQSTSAFELMQIRQARIDQQALNDLISAQGQGEDEEIEPIPRYPHKSLSFDLFDGTHVLRALEFETIPEFDLADTPLGIKVSLRISSPPFLDQPSALRSTLWNGLTSCLPPVDAHKRRRQTWDRLPEAYEHENQRWFDESTER